MIIKMIVSGLFTVLAIASLMFGLLSTCDPQRGQFAPGGIIGFMVFVTCAICAGVYL